MATCRKHSHCRKVPGNGSVLEIVRCPWCGWEVSTSNIGKWCAKCYCKFEVMNDGFVHFSKDFPKTTAEMWAMAFAKGGGLGFGSVKPEKLNDL